MLALTLVSEEAAIKNRRKLASSTTPLSFDAPTPRNPREYRVYMLQ